MPDVPVPQQGWQLFALGSAGFAALTAILGKLGVSEVNSNLATLIRTVVILAFLSVPRGTATRRVAMPLGEIAPRTACCSWRCQDVATGLSWLCYYRALAMAPASLVAPVDKLSVVLVMVLAVALLGEPLTWRLALGGGLIAAGVLVVARA